MKKIIAISISLFLIALVGCSKSPSAKQEADHHLAIGESIRLANGDLQETTASTQELPAFLDDKDETMQIIYQAAAENSDLLQWIPCYCGCAESADHQHNGNCFYKEIRPDGVVVWDDHGTRCNACLETAAYSVMMKQEGKNLLEIRNWIDQNYKEGYAPPTPTPMPQG